MSTLVVIAIFKQDAQSTSGDKCKKSTATKKECNKMRLLYFLYLAYIYVTFNVPFYD